LRRSDPYALGPDGPRRFSTRAIVCPNPKCKKFTLSASMHEITYDSLYRASTGSHIHTWQLIPASKAQSFPDFIPRAIISDYNEACLICDLSPKASATLSRRCLQGIIRDFWQIKPGRLVDEIDQIKDKVDPMTWDAIDSVRKVGNIGAHMEKDIDLIVDVDPSEATILIELIENLLKDWYITREERRARLLQIKGVAETKDKEKKVKKAITT
jgi:hypothetical protein